MDTQERLKQVDKDIEALLETKKALETELAEAEKPKHGDYRDGHIYLKYQGDIVETEGFAFARLGYAIGHGEAVRRFNELDGPTVNVFDLIKEHEAVQEPLERFDIGYIEGYFNGLSNLCIRQDEEDLVVIQVNLIDDFILNTRRMRATQLRKNADSLHRGADKV